MFTVSVPAVGPWNAHAYNVSSTAASLHWETIPDRYSNGKIQQYRILWEHLSLGKSWRTVVDGKQFQVHIDGLQPFTNYSFRVAGVNHRGVGIDTLPIYVRTDESGMSWIDIFKGLLLDVSSLFTNTPTRWRYNEREIWIMHDAKQSRVH